MTEGFTTSVGIARLSPAQRHHLQTLLQQEAISATWRGDVVDIDQAFEARVETLVDQASALPPGAPVAPTAPQPFPGTYGTYGAYGGYGYPAPPQANSNATLSLVFGVGSIALCALLAIPAVIFGHRARREIAESNGTQTGSGLATAGIIIGYLYIGLMALGLLAFLALVLVGAFSTPSTR